MAGGFGREGAKQSVLMRKYLLYLPLTMMFGCFSIKVMHSDNDDASIFQQNEHGEIWISSMSSAQQIKITKQEQVGDTLLITYRRGAFLSSKNVIQLSDRVKYVKRANFLYAVRTKGGMFNLEKIEND